MSTGNVATAATAAAHRACVASCAHDTIAREALADADGRTTPVGHDEPVLAALGDDVRVLAALGDGRADGVDGAPASTPSSLADSARE
jgi:hypothetical protein